MRLKAKLLTVALMPLSLIGLAACEPGQTSATNPHGNKMTDLTPMKAETKIRLQSVSFKWQSETVTHDYLCAPTRFPPFKVGGGEPFSGGAFGQGRGDKVGWSPVPQWAHVETKAGALLLRLACEGQWQGLKQLSGSETASTIEVFALKKSNDVIGLSPITVSGLSITAPRKPSGSQAMSEQIETLLPLAEILQAYPQVSRADPILINLGQRLPSKAERPFLSKPWVIKCDGDLPRAGTIEGSMNGLFFTRPGQSALSASPEFRGCEFVEYLDTNSIDYKKRPLSPYPESVLHLITESGEEVFVEVRRMTLRDPQLFMHSENMGSFQGALERDPFLDTEFFKTNATGLTAFENRP